MTRSDALGLILAIGLGIALLAGAGVAAVYAWEESANGKKWAPALAAAEKKYGLPPGLLSRQAYEESGFQTDVINGTEPSSAGALGILQLMPQYYPQVNVPVPFTDADVLAQIDAAAATDAANYQTFGSWPLALAAYNAGAGAVQASGGNLSLLPQQTQNYVAQITADVPAALA